MDVYQANIQSYGSLYKLKFINGVRGYLNNKKIIEYTWDPTASMSTLLYFLADTAKHKVRVNQLLVFYDSIWRDCPDTVRITGAYIVFYQGVPIDH